ncbi:hypothetical protein [Streptosporangium sp. NBC_01756]|uniref:hypothetical protein n=1 Tax=Streptosporangium sp. NBC_01756 TaxID=2975950 RepID=UPI002DD96306|nr:hypothetical protein [Streptosporangium sp. NBC_01756]
MYEFPQVVGVVFLLLFVYVLDGTMGAGIGADRAAYVGYLTPGIMITTIVGAAQGTAISVATDMTEGIIARFKTMAIARVSVLTGHVLGAMVQTFLAIAMVTVVASPSRSRRGSWSRHRTPRVRPWRRRWRSARLRTSRCWPGKRSRTPAPPSSPGTSE